MSGWPDLCHAGSLGQLNAHAGLRPILVSTALGGACLVAAKPEPLPIEEEHSDPFKHPRQARFQSLAYFFDVHHGNVPDSPLDSAVVGPMQGAARCRLLLRDPLLLAYPADCTAKADADVERHRVPYWDRAAYASTSDE